MSPRFANIFVPGCSAGGELIPFPSSEAVQPDARRGARPRIRPSVRSRLPSWTVAAHGGEGTAASGNTCRRLLTRELRPPVSPRLAVAPGPALRGAVQAYAGRR